MKNNTFGKSLGMKEHLLSGKPITAIEALMFFGIPSLTGPIYSIRQEGWVVKKKRIPFAKAMKRINEYAVLKPPKNLPIREIQLTEYWLSK
jgi:hypothetical protein